MAAISLGTDVDASRGEKVGNFKKILISDHAAGVSNRQLRGDVKIEVQPNAYCVRSHLGGRGGDLRTMTGTLYVCKHDCQLQNRQAH